jgi:hypothetical protein
VLCYLLLLSGPCYGPFTLSVVIFSTGGEPERPIYIASDTFALGPGLSSRDLLDRDTRDLRAAASICSAPRLTAP